MKPLIDSDVLRYEIGYCAHYKDDDGEPKIRDFDFVAGLLDAKVELICEMVMATKKPVLYLTGDAKLYKRMKREGYKVPKKFKPNFREKVAISKPYKGTRKSEKPFHFDNLTAYLLANYKVKVAWGMEADDLMSIDQVASKKDTVICSRDKDLKITQGWHFSWECGKQPQWGPEEVDEIGEIELTSKGIKGTGLSFFYSQMLTGDTVDNIGGCKGVGPAGAFKALEGCSTEAELYSAVAELYEAKYGEDWKTYYKEQANLLWMVQELDIHGKPVFHKPYWERM